MKKMKLAGDLALSTRRKPQRDGVDLQPHVAVAPGLLDGDHAVIGESDDSDADYESRARLLAAALAFARKG